MPRYAITEKAGRFVAGYSNNGVGSALDLTERQAEHEVRLGTLVLIPDEEAAPEDVPVQSASMSLTPPKTRASKAAPTKGA